MVISPPPWLVATRTCLMLDVAIASARFVCVRLLLFVRRIYSKFFGEHACAWIKADKDLMRGGISPIKNCELKPPPPWGRIAT